MKYNTPFIFLPFEHNEYIELVNNLDYYLNLPLIINDNGLSYIKGNLGKKINFVFNHYMSSDEIIQKWGRRVKRFNFENCLIKMTLNDEEDIERFKKIKIKNKIGFYYKKVDVENIIYLGDWYNTKIRFRYNWRFYAFTNSTVETDINFGRYYNVFKLLNGESDFMRNIKYK